MGLWLSSIFSRVGPSAGVSRAQTRTPILTRRILSPSGKARLAQLPDLASGNGLIYPQRVTRKLTLGMPRIRALACRAQFDVRAQPAASTPESVAAEMLSSFRGRDHDACRAARAQAYPTALQALEPLQLTSCSLCTRICPLVSRHDHNTKIPIFLPGCSRAGFGPADQRRATHRRAAPREDAPHRRLSARDLLALRPVIAPAIASLRLPPAPRLPDDFLAFGIYKFS